MDIKDLTNTQQLILLIVISLLWNIFFFFFKLWVYLFIYLWLCWVFVSVRGLSLVAASGGHSSSRCAGLSLSRPLLLRSTGSRRAGSVIVAHRPSCSAACGIFPDQGSNPCPLHWQADSQPLRHQGTPWNIFFYWWLMSLLGTIPDQNKIVLPPSNLKNQRASVGTFFSIRCITLNEKFLKVFPWCNG